MRALGNEVCKNIALAGVGKITILDHETVQEQDLGAHFFLTENDIGKNVRSANSMLFRFGWLYFLACVCCCSGCTRVESACSSHCGSGTHGRQTRRIFWFFWYRVLYASRSRYSGTVRLGYPTSSFHGSWIAYTRYSWERMHYEERLENRSMQQTLLDGLDTSFAICHDTCISSTYNQTQAMRSTPLNSL